LIICKTDAQDGIKIYVDPASAPGLKASKFIDRIDFIPLETTNESRYSSTNRFIMSKDQFLIMDNTNNALFIFDKQSGKFLYKYKNSKNKYKIDAIQYVPSKNAVLIKSVNRHYTISDKKALQLVEKWKGKDISRYVLM